MYYGGSKIPFKYQRCVFRRGSYLDRGLWILDVNTDFWKSYNMIYISISFLIPKYMLVRGKILREAWSENYSPSALTLFHLCHSPSLVASFTNSLLSISWPTGSLLCVHRRAYVCNQRPCGVIVIRGKFLLRNWPLTKLVPPNIAAKINSRNSCLLPIELTYKDRDWL